LSDRGRPDHGQLIVESKLIDSDILASPFIEVESVRIPEERNANQMLKDDLRRTKSSILPRRGDEFVEYAKLLTKHQILANSCLNLKSEIRPCERSNVS
jgi:hypothetical protein